MLIVVILTGYPRVTLNRKVSTEGIGDPAAVEAYDRLSKTPQFAYIRSIFVNELKKHDPKGIIVDVGCGPGYLMAALAREVPQAHLIGVDISEEMLTTASENLSSLGFREEAEFRKGEADSLPFENDSVDNVVSTLSLHHWSDASRAFQEIHRVMKPGGQLLLLDLRRDPRRLLYWLITFATRITPLFLGTHALRRIDEPLGSLLASYTPQELTAILSKMPFTGISLKAGFGWIFLWAQK